MSEAERKRSEEEGGHLYMSQNTNMMRVTQQCFNGAGYQASGFHLALV